MSVKNHFPAFFDQAPILTVRDPLAEFLGAAENGVITYCYADVVKLAGHSCPTVASAYVATLKGLKALYGDELPVRGEIEVLMSGKRDEGTVGVIATVVQLLTGAAPETGFGGIGIASRFARRNLLNFDQPIAGTFALRRQDNGKTVVLTFNLEEVAPWSEAIRALMPKAVGGSATAKELKLFAQVWQERVRKILIDFVADERLILLETLA